MHGEVFVKRKFYILALLSALIFGCGKNNQVNTSNSGGLNQVLAPSSSPLNASTLGHVFTSYPCGNGKRLQEVKFSTSQFNFSGDTLFSNFAPGYLTGTDYDRFVGISSFNDVLVLEKVSNGNQVMGYNATVSLCEYGALVQAGMNFQNIQFNNGITISENLNCSYGSILSTSSVMQPSNGFYPVETVFTVPTTNGCPF